MWNSILTSPPLQKKKKKKKKKKKFNDIGIVALLKNATKNDMRFDQLLGC
jgi:hypothetical protein